MSAELSSQVFNALIRFVTISEQTRATSDDCLTRIEPGDFFLTFSAVDDAVRVKTERVLHTVTEQGQKIKSLVSHFIVTHDHTHCSYINDNTTGQGEIFSSTVHSRITSCLMAKFSSNE